MAPEAQNSHGHPCPAKPHGGTSGPPRIGADSPHPSLSTDLRQARRLLPITKASASQHARPTARQQLEEEPHV